jgi:uncharacterized membrane protein YhiD involved in acid resistance
MEARGPGAEENVRQAARLRRQKSKTRQIYIVVGVAAALLGFTAVALLLNSRRGPDESRRPAETAPARSTPTPQADSGAVEIFPGVPLETKSPTPRPGASPQASDAPREQSFFAQIFELEERAAEPGQAREPLDWLTTFARVTVRLTLAALLSALLAFRPRRFSLFSKRNPFVAQTQILLAVVASALMMIVGDSAARAFGIFAAVSLVRFRTNIKDPKEITVLLVSLAIGLATGVGRWELALILAFFVLLLLWGLEYRETEQVTRAMELTVKTRNVDVTQDVLLRLFRKYDFDAEVRTLDRPDGEDEVGCIVYYVDISPFVSTDRLSEEILSADAQNVDSVEWDQQKNTSYFYQ